MRLLIPVFFWVISFFSFSAHAADDDSDSNLTSNVSVDPSEVARNIQQLANELWEWTMILTRPKPHVVPQSLLTAIKERIHLILLQYQAELENPNSQFLSPQTRLALKIAFLIDDLRKNKLLPVADELPDLRTDLICAIFYTSFGIAKPAESISLSFNTRSMSAFFNHVLKSVLEKKEGKFSFERWQNDPTKYRAILEIFGSNDIIKMLSLRMETLNIASQIVPFALTPQVNTLSQFNKLRVTVQSLYLSEPFKPMTCLLYQVVAYPLQHGDAFRIKRLQLIELLLVLGADPDECDVITKAIEQEDADLLELILSYGANPNMPSTTAQYPLHRAIQKRNLRMIQLLLQYGAESENSNLGNAVIAWITKGFGEEYSHVFGTHIRELYERKIDLNLRNDRGDTALHIATYTKDHALICILLDYEDAVDFNIQNARGNTPLHVAAYNGDLNIFTLLYNGPTDVDLSNHKGYTALHFAVMKGHLQIVNLLLKGKKRVANINAPDSDGDTPLHMAVMKNHFHIVQALLENGADPLITNVYGLTPLQYAQEEAIKTLLKNAIHERLPDLEAPMNATQTTPSSTPRPPIIIYTNQRC